MTLSMCFIFGCSSSNKTDADKKNETLIYEETKRKVKRGDPDYRTVRDIGIEEATPVTGSIFSNANAKSIYDEQNNYRVGDMIIIRVNETMSAKDSMHYQTDKKGMIDLKPEITVGNVEINKGNANAKYEHNKNINSSLSIDSQSSLTGTIAVAIKKILPNGNLLVAGEKWIKVDEEQKFIRLSGQVRISDIDENHSVDSTMVGEAFIEVGSGEDGQDTDESIVTKLLNIFG